MNKKFFITLVISLLIGASAFAQTIMFTLSPNAQAELSSQVKSQLDLKLTQALTKNSALAGGQDGVFVVESSMVLGKVTKIEDPNTPVASAHGELTLVVKNRIDGSMYHSVVIPIRGNVMGTEEDLKLDMIKRLKVADPLFTKFVTTAREKIKSYYQTNCAAIVQKAETYYRSKEYEKCVIYLQSIPESVGCYEQAAFLIEMCKNPQ
ncbi:MAG: hypothetical protein KBT20_05185 [Bacteroidales bacterium]|nr:hypothetical protein [Candidatus Liminaster caballi]